jgi:Wzt C-terminal domain
VFVSHNLSAVEMMCQRTVWLDHGRVRQAGPTAEVVQAYLDAVDRSLLEEVKPGAAGPGPGAAERGPRAGELGDEPAVIEETTLLDARGRPSADVESGQPLRLRLRCLVRAPLPDLTCAVTVRGDYGPLFSATSPAARLAVGRHALECRLEPPPLLPGLYRVEAELRHGGAGPVPPRTVAAFRVTTGLARFGSASPVGATKSRGGFLAVPYAWHLETPAGEQRLPGLRAP